jgi:predicted CXXCH cytochrome family protein
MDHATPQSVLGDFSNVTFDYWGVRSRFFHEGEKFFVETDGADGKLAKFEIKYTFGVDPLQQYLIEFPGGRLQALSIAWDSRPKQNGGQRWFHLYPNEQITHDDVLHWTKLNQNWNFMCAECHSTGVYKNYDPVRDGYATTWSEISVGCEACHGEGSRHVAWAHEQKGASAFAQTSDPAKGLLVRLDERASASWHRNSATGQPQRSTPPQLLRKEVETCGRCHARRGTFAEDWVPGRWLSSTHHVAPMSGTLFHADGQMRDGEETYNYAPFKQSKMFAAGVTCSDCHDPHSASLRADGDAVCSQCHAAERYQSPAHSHHTDVRRQPSCAACHMPERTYMVVDRRHDHSFRVPRPDLSVQLGTPNACTDCHQNQSAQWAATAIETWFGPQRRGFQDYATAFHGAWTDQPGAERQLAELAAGLDHSAYVRASALGQLSVRSPPDMQLARAGLADADPMVRVGALDMLEALPAEQRWSLASHLLADPVRGVRLRAASLLAFGGAMQLSAEERRRFESAAREFIDAQRLNADRPEARTTLGNFLVRRGQWREAEGEYQAALRIAPQYAPAYVNLADLYRQTDRNADAERTLRGGVTVARGDAGIHHALGLTLVRLKRLEEAVGELRQAADLERSNARYAYVYGIALYSSGRRSEAVTVLKENLARHPHDANTLLALANLSHDAGDLSAALEYAKELARMRPEDLTIARLVERLQREAPGLEPK